MRRHRRLEKKLKTGLETLKAYLVPEIIFLFFNVNLSRISSDLAARCPCVMDALAAYAVSREIFSAREVVGVLSEVSFGIFGRDYNVTVDVTEWWSACFFPCGGMRVTGVGVCILFIIA